MAESKTEKQKVQEITEKLEQGIKELFESEKYKTYLNTMSKFHNYSFNNTMLIAMQKPDATLVAGFKACDYNEEYYKLLELYTCGKYQEYIFYFIQHRKSNIYGYYFIWSYEYSCLKKGDI